MLSLLDEEVGKDVIDKEQLLQKQENECVFQHSLQCAVT